MKSAVETLSPTRVKVSVEVPFSELEPSVKKAYHTISQQVRVPGFRPGKVPARLIDQKVGRSAVLQEAAQEAIPDQYMAAIREHEVKVIGRPEVELTELSDGDKLAFTAEVDVRPTIDLPDLDSVSVQVDDVEVTDSDVEDRLGVLRDRFSTLKTVDRGAAIGDHVSLDLKATIDGKDVEGGTATNHSYEVGSGRLLDGIDDAVVGLTAGGSATFTTKLLGGDHAGEEAEVSVTVNTVREKELPALDDEFAQLASEFDTLDELRADERTKAERAKRYQQADQARDKALEALVSGAEVPVPEGVVTEQVDYRKESMSEQLAQIGSTLDQYLAAEGKEQEEFDAELRTSVEEEVRNQLVLDTLADAEEVGVNDQELTQEVLRRAQYSGMQPQQYADQLARGGGLGAVVADVRRGKALAMLLEHATITDASGNKVDLNALNGETAAADEAAGAGEAVEAAGEAPEATSEPAAEAASDSAKD